MVVPAKEHNCGDCAVTARPHRSGHDLINHNDGGPWSRGLNLVCRDYVTDLLGDKSIHAMERRSKVERSIWLVTLEKKVQLAAQMHVMH